MDDRYRKPEIAELWKDEAKLLSWQEVELAVIEARVTLGRIPAEIYVRTREILAATPIDVEWFKVRDGEINHDFNAFIDERRRHLPADLQPYFHQDMTSYDGQEAAFANRLKKSTQIVRDRLWNLQHTLEGVAKRYQYTPMFGVTHGQNAEMESFGKRVARLVSRS